VLYICPERNRGSKRTKGGKGKGDRGGGGGSLLPGQRREEIKRKKARRRAKGEKTRLCLSSLLLSIPERIKKR